MTDDAVEAARRNDAQAEAMRLRVCIERACEAIDTLELGHRDAVLRLRTALASAQAESAVTVEREKGLLAKCEEIAMDEAEHQLDLYDHGHDTYGHHAAEAIARKIRALASGQQGEKP